MDMIRHDDEVMQLEAMLCDKRTEYIDEESGIALRLQNPLSHGRPSRNKEFPYGVEDGDGSCVSAGMRHSRG
jgi:hypothetical protein